MDDLFIHEDTSKLENRINLSLFGVLSADIFRAWFQQRLGLSPRAVIYPSKNVVGDGGSIRPDFVIRDGDSDAVVGWIEVECGRDDVQLARFREQLGERVFAVWGYGTAPADLGLDEIATFISSIDATAHHPQVHRNLRHLHDLIVEALEGPGATSYKVAAVTQTTLDTPFVRALRAALGDRLNFDLSKPIRRGEIRAQTFGERGFSLRVFSEVASEKSVSLLNQSGGRPEIRFSSEEKLGRYLPKNRDAVARLASLVRELGGDMAGIRETQITAVPIEKATQRAEELARVAVDLAEGGK